MKPLEKAYIPYFDKSKDTSTGYQITPHKPRHFYPNEHKRELFELRLSLGDVTRQAAIHQIILETGWAGSVVDEHLPTISKAQWRSYNAAERTT